MISKRAILFPGQGAQSPSMLEDFQQSKNYQPYLQIITNLLGENPEKHIRKEGYVHKNEVASLLTVLCSLCAAESSKKMTPDNAYAGYSVGQYTAMYFGGYLSIENLFELVFKRALVMNTSAKENPALMFSVIGLTYEQIEKVCKGIVSKNGKIYVSNYNCLGQVTLASDKPSFEQAKIEFKNLSARKVHLLTSEGGWHSPFMQSAENEFLKNLSEYNFFKTPIKKVICNRYGNYLPTKNDSTLNTHLAEHISHPVLWEKGIRTLIQDGVEEFVEVGYGNTLTKFGFFIDRKLKHSHDSKL